jgi:hypothetical protein
MLDKKQLSDINDSYYLKTIHIDSLIKLIDKIYNPICLNYACYKHMQLLTAKTLILLLKQMCITNNLLNPKYLYDISASIWVGAPSFRREDIIKVMKICLANKYYTMLTIIFCSNTEINKFFFASFMEFYMGDDSNMLNDIDEMVSKNVMSYTHMYMHFTRQRSSYNICNMGYKWINLFEKTCAYLESHIDPLFLKCFK